VEQATALKDSDHGDTAALRLTRPV